MRRGGVGRVHTQRTLLFDECSPLTLESGATLAPVQVAYETYGALDADARFADLALKPVAGGRAAANESEWRARSNLYPRRFRPPAARWREWARRA